jgi:hypothetical protein
MIVVLTAFSLFHLVAGTAGLGLAVRFLTPKERAHWTSKRALLVAEVLCWVYPVLAFAAAHFAWKAYDSGDFIAAPIILSPFVWLVAMGITFAIVDFAEDGVLGNARADRPKE